jgi:enamine deaminase RidA (YjgF/YER057c/UK114 family)
VRANQGDAAAVVITSAASNVNENRQHLQKHKKIEHEGLVEGPLIEHRCCHVECEISSESTHSLLQDEFDESDMLTEFVPQAPSMPRSQAMGRLNMVRISGAIGTVKKNRGDAAAPQMQQCWVDSACKNIVVIGTRSLRTCLTSHDHLLGSEMFFTDCDDQQEIDESIVAGCGSH